LTDTELVTSILAGDMRALEALMNLHKRTLLRTARAILRDDAEAEDAVQEACLQAYRALGTFRGESKLSTWLVRIAANEALMRRRRNARAGAPMDMEPNDLPSGDPGPDGDAVRAGMRRRLNEGFEELPEVFRDVFRLRALEDLTVDETAAALGIPEATVRTRYFRARSLLRKSMAREWDKPSSLESPLLITEQDLKRLRLLKPHAALLREIGRAVVISPKAAILADVVTMNTQVFFTDETTAAKQHMNLVYPQEAGGCVCCVSVLAPMGTALLGLSAGRSIEWDFPDGSHRRLRVDQVIHHDCPINVAAA
jgi:RNA polymerase sigma-70 factor, ECF subfamily